MESNVQQTAAVSLQPLADGTIAGSAPVQLPVMAPRLQADLTPDGTLSLALWGSGKIGTISFPGWKGPYNYAPNRLIAADGAFYVAQSAPVLVMRNARVGRLTPARRCAWWDTPKPPAEVVRRKGRVSTSTGWGVILTEQRDTDVVVAVGASEDEARTALALSVQQIVSEGDAYVTRCDGLPSADPVMRSMVMQGQHAVFSSVRSDEQGRFAGLAAGQAYSAPARTYYRDGFWTLQGLLRPMPEAVRAQIDILAAGMQPDGEAPSGVILTGPAQSAAWEKVRRNDTIIREEHLRPGDWWSDHFDSPLFFVLTVRDYVATTGDLSPAREHWDRIRTVFRRYLGFCRDGGSLPVKPRHDRDWADNVYRHGYVSYDLGLWIGALDGIVAMAPSIDPALGEEAAKVAKKARAELDAALLTADGWYADYGTKADFREDHLTLDSLTLLRFDAVSPERAAKVLAACARRLETRNNAEQPHGDWGVMCAFPPFARRADTRAKSAFALRYHNGSDWPYLDGLYAGEIARRGGDARYPLTRWWETCLAQGWAGAVEYFSPPFGRGSLLQGWSGLPAAVAVNNATTHAHAVVSREERA